MTNGDATINALVAQHVLGWKRLSELAWQPPERPDYIGGESSPPDACNDGRVMLRVIEAMAKRGFTARTFESPTRSKVIFEGGDESVLREADSLPRAVALTALMALGVEVPQ